MFPIVTIVVVYISYTQLHFVLVGLGGCIFVSVKLHKHVSKTTACKRIISMYSFISMFFNQYEGNVKCAACLLYDDDMNVLCNGVYVFIDTY